ncbi:hypothetical protein [Hymenobacter rubidus]|uniref:hypothetical protein n=1 Tax=Hymenobacter rubidus TaxID=1441626 RepID=UPI00191DB430|nr:hypothetical protein [Hymenobacter rubidus]
MERGNITAWLASAQPYAQGAALYAQVGTNKTYLRLFALPETVHSRQALVRELRALVAGGRPEIAGPTPPAPPAAAAEPVAPTGGPTSPILATVRQQLRAVRDERSQRHAQLTARNLGKRARYELAVRILALTDQEGKLKAAEAHVRQHGRLPGPVPTAEITDAGVLRQRLGNLVSQRTKLRKNPDRAADLAGAEAEITLIRSKLKS